MKTQHLVAPVATLLAVMLAGCDEGEIDRPSIMHQPEWQDREVILGDPVVISESGEITLAGKPLSVAEIEEQLTVSENGRTVLPVKISENASFAKAFASLSTISQRADHLRFEIGSSGEFSKAESSKGSAWQAPPFILERAEIDLPVVASYASSSDQCIIALDGKTMGSEEIFDVSFQWLENVIQGSWDGRVPLEEIELPTARIQIEPGTPWRCVGGAVHNIERAGWAWIELVLTDEDWR